MAIIKCPECGKEVSDQSDVCIHCGYPIKQQATNLVDLVGSNVQEVEVVSTTPTSIATTKVANNTKVEAYDVMILEYNSLKISARANLMKICDITRAEANDILDSLPCYIYDDISKDDAEEIARRLVNCDFRVAVYDPVGNVRYFEPPQYINRPLPILVPVPRRKRMIIRRPVIAPRPRAIKMPRSSPGIGIGLKPNHSTPLGRNSSRPQATNRPGTSRPSSRPNGGMPSKHR